MKIFSDDRTTIKHQNGLILAIVEEVCVHRKTRRWRLSSVGAVLLAISLKVGTVSQLLLVEPESTVVDVDELAGGDVLGVMDAVGLNENSLVIF